MSGASVNDMIVTVFKAAMFGVLIAYVVGMVVIFKWLFELLGAW
jgi:hypothetical protein